MSPARRTTTRYGEPESADELFGVREQELVLGGRVLGRVNENCSTLLNWWTRNIPRVSCPAAFRSRGESTARTRRSGGQLVGLEDLPGVEARERDLGGAREVEAVGGQLVHVRLVRRECARADPRSHGRARAGAR